MVTFGKESGGTIPFDFNAAKFYAVIQSGTSVPLYEEEILFVPAKRCECINPECKAQERHFSPEQVLPVPVRPVHTAGDSQEYAVKYSCWVTVNLYDQDQVDAACPQGFVPALCTQEYGHYHVQYFLHD